MLFITPLDQMLVNDGFEKGIEEEIEKGPRALISNYHETGLSYDNTCKKLIEKLELDSSAADRYMEEFWVRTSV